MIKTEIAGCFLYQVPIHHDERGAFVKPFSTEGLEQYGVNFQVAETYFSWSQKNVLRGMHFQLPPAHHQKIVTCFRGEVLDVVLDLRRDSPTYGRTFSTLLSAADRSAATSSAVFIPKGCAHGFLSLQDDSLLGYWVDSVHSPAHDSGILWNSFGFSWPVDKVLTSPRDADLTPFSKFDSPFS